MAAATPSPVRAERHRTRLTAAAVVLAAVALAACASARIDAQWAAPGLADTRPLNGARVMVACQAPQVVLARLCTDRLQAEALQRGLQLVPVPQAEASPATGAPDDAALLASARAAGATILWAATVTPDPVRGNEVGSGVSIGIGGFGVGHRGGVGVGVGVPVGGGWSGRESYTMEARVREAAGGRLIWTARARSEAGGDPQPQIDGLARRLADAAAQAPLY